MAITSDSFDGTTQTTNVTVTATPNPPLPLEITSTNSTAFIPTIPAPTTPIITNNLDDAQPGINPLPIRGEKRIIPSAVYIPAVQETFDNGAFADGTTPSHQITTSDFYITAAKKTFTDFIKIKIPHRGINASSGIVDTSKDAEFRFLINPRTVAVSKQMVDTQAFTRGGWQFGVWGEDISQIRISGQTAGTYFGLGLTDEHQYYAQSYRNLLQLQQVFENNGYWFEGEEYNEGPMAADYLRRRIRMHQDLELWVGNFIWYGMFESMNISQTADNPFQYEFEMTFVAWKERYRDSSGYWDGKRNNVQRGHSYSAVEAATNKTANDVTVAQTTAMSTDARITQLQSTANQNSNSPAVAASSAEDLLPTVDTQAMDAYGPTENLLLDPAHLPMWNTQ